MLPREEVPPTVLGEGGRAVRHAAGCARTGRNVPVQRPITSPTGTEGDTSEVRHDPASVGIKKGVGCAVALGALVVILVFGIINPAGAVVAAPAARNLQAPTRLPQSRQPK
jgi:hypothetical protein